ncbi:nuclear pore complex protein NUP160 isoform X1 [Amborella trichopoda]|uniref:nuclear pore complex protein NUP160 isoform X1 n=1 Tax=Amborella trichopoda TaxID=13333 RepID=UPI0009BD40A2|nr:nuclear pore complex protein NUP160 isoform X1 [Amborella trichopoda]|eukprot:XP_020527451.1 nuclear pore complex protein NUP160 isoform X1 [Amborella trichopoda]
MAAPAVSARPFAGMEVPLLGSDSIQWSQVTVPSSLSPSPQTVAPITENIAGCHVIGDSSRYIIWRIHKNVPNTIELVELSPNREFPKGGLRLIFKDSLCPFAYICRHEVQNTSGISYVLYALTVSGVAYLFKLRSPSTYVSGSIFPEADMIEFDIQRHPLHPEKITAVSATLGLLTIGGQDGSVFCCQLGVFDESSPGFLFELREEVGITRLWGHLGRGRRAGPVQSQVVADIYGRNLLFVLHTDGSLRVWDLIDRVKLLSHNLSLVELEGFTPLRLEVGNVSHDADTMALVVQYGSLSGPESDKVVIYGFDISFGDKITLSPQSSVQHVYLEGKLVDMKLCHSKLWVLKEYNSMLYSLFHTDLDRGSACNYCLQEAVVADQLFQSSDCAADDLLCIGYAISSLMKGSVSQFLSSTFVRRLLLLGVHQHSSLCASLRNHISHLTDSNFQYLTVEGLEKEMYSAIQNEGVAESPLSVMHNWKTFCSQYFQFWCQESVPYGILVDPLTGGTGLVRRNSISWFRYLEDIESFLFGPFSDAGDFVNSGLVLLDDDLDSEILCEILRCINSINHQLGKAARAALYESLVNPDLVIFDDVIPRFVKILESGYDSFVRTNYASHYEGDTAHAMEHMDHKNQRMFAIDMLLSLQTLCNKAGGWGRILNVIENYLNYLIWERSEVGQSSDAKSLYNMHSEFLVYATSQVAKVLLEASCDLLLLLNYVVTIRGQLGLMDEENFKIKVQLIPVVHDIIKQWFVVHMMGTTPSECPVLEDFSSQLSSLHIDNKNVKRSWDGKFGTLDLTLASILLLEYPITSEERVVLLSGSFPEPNSFRNLVRNFSGWIVLGKSRDKSLAFYNHAIPLAGVLLQHGQYAAIEKLFITIDKHLLTKKISQSIPSFDDEWSASLHLLGFCLLVRAQCGLHGVHKERKVCEAIRCFFRAASGQGVSQALQNIPFQTSLPFPGSAPEAAWKLHYYEWVMQIFEQYRLSHGACQFALAALEQVDEVVGLEGETHITSPLPESASSIKGRLWANVFKFTLDLNQFFDAYCAIISNPDEESKYVCLRRFIIVLCEHGATKVLCDGELPFVGLIEKVEQELVWKAERSDIRVKPNPYKLLYGIQMYQHNWRKASAYMYRYCVRLAKEVTSMEYSQLSLALQERLHALTAAINALHLVRPAYAWIESLQESYSFPDQQSPSKRLKSLSEDVVNSNDEQAPKQQHHVDIEKLEKEYVLTSAELLLTQANLKLTSRGSFTFLADTVDQLVEANLYDTAFTVILKFWKGSDLKRELERAFVVISQKCCLNRFGTSAAGTIGHPNYLLLSSSDDQRKLPGFSGVKATTIQFKANNQWQTLEHYLEIYKKLHPRLPVTVVETLLYTDPYIELPLWLVDMFKGGRRAMPWGMTGQESDPACLFRLYVDYGRYTEATNLLLEYIEAFAAMRPVDIVRRKKMCAVWFPYTSIERLWSQLSEMRSSGLMVDQCDKLQKLLHGTLLNHLKQLVYVCACVRASEAKYTRVYVTIEHVWL